MKIALSHAFYGGRAGGGGGVRQMTELARGLKNLGHEVVIVSHEYEPGTITPDPADEFEIRSVNTGPVHLPTGRAESLKFAWSSTREIAKLIPEDVDVVNVHENPGHFAGYYAKRRLDVPVVWTRNDYTLYEFTVLPEETWLPAGGVAGRMARRAISLPERHAARAMDAICVLDSRNARMVERSYGRTARVIQSGAAPKFFAAPSKSSARSHLGIADGEFLVLGVGILMHYRRFEDLILAAGQMQDDARIHTRIIGSDHLSPDYGEQLRELVVENNLDECVKLLTEGASDEDLLAHYAAADVFVFPNELQTWGLAPIEAIAARTPVIISRGAGVHEVLEGHEGVQLVDPRSPDQIAAAIRAVAANPGAFDPAATREWVREEFSNQRFAEKMAALFEELIATKR